MSEPQLTPKDLLFLAVAGIASAMTVLAWCEPEPQSPPDSLFCEDHE